MSEEAPSVPRTLTNHDALAISNDRLQTIELQALFSFHSERSRAARGRLEDILRMVPESQLPSDVDDLLVEAFNENYWAGEFHGRCVERAEEHKFRLMERETKDRDRRHKRVGRDGSHA